MTQTDTQHEAPAQAETRQQYRMFNSYGFLRVSRWDAERGEYVQIGSFAGPDANQRANERIAEDRAAEIYAAEEECRMAHRALGLAKGENQATAADYARAEKAAIALARATWEVQS